MDKSYQQYIKKFIHAKKQWRLKQIMDSDHALPEYITDWESKLVVPLGIPANKVKDIKAAHPTQPVLERLVAISLMSHNSGIVQVIIIIAS